jgi:hypothetical protein
MTVSGLYAHVPSMIGISSNGVPACEIGVVVTLIGVCVTTIRFGVNVGNGV